MKSPECPNRISQFWSLQCLPHNFLNIGPILTKPVPIESSRSGLSIRAGFVKIGSILRKLWAKQK